MLTYLICSTPRTGSNLLCGMLNRTGVAGRPREYFCPANIAKHGPELCGLGAIGSGADLHRFIDAAEGAFSSNGRFGIKTHLHQLQSALAAGYDLRARFPDRFVYLTRADEIGRAISSVKALQSGAWKSKDAPRGSLRFDPQAIQREIQRTLRENAAWEELFARLGVEPYRLSYEELCADFEGSLSGVLEFLDVEPECVDVADAVRGATEYYRPQRDEMSAEWRRGYRAWLRQRAAERAAAPARVAG